MKLLENLRGKSLAVQRMKELLEELGASKTVVIENGLKHETYILDNKRYLFVSVQRALSGDIPRKES